MKELINKTVVLDGIDYTITEDDCNFITNNEWRAPVVDGKFAPWLAAKLILQLYVKHRSTLSLDQIHTIAAQLLEVDKSWLYDKVSKYNADIRNPRRVKSIEELKRDISIVHEWREAQARVGDQFSFEEFAKGYKKNYLLARPKNASPDALGVSSNGRIKYYKTDRSILEQYYKKRDIKSILLKPETVKEHPTVIGKSKIGGLADLPKNKDYPIGNDGHPMRLLCQIQTEEVYDSTWWSHPHPGLISFFCSVDCYQLFTGKPHMEVIFTPEGETLHRKSYFHPKAEPFAENNLKFQIGKTIQLPPWEGALEMQERLNRDPTMMHDIVDKSFDNAKPSLYGYGKHSLMNYQQLGDKKISHHMLKGWSPLLYFPSYLDVDKSISIGDGGAVVFFTKGESRESGDYSQVPYAYFTK